MKYSVTPRFSLALAALTAMLSALPAGVVQAREEVNVYSYRQPFLVEPMFETFKSQTGIRVNVIFAKSGLIERISNEGRNSPADILLTSDIGNLSAAVESGIAQAVHSDTLNAAIPAAFRDPDGRWFGLTLRARIIVTSKDRVPQGAITRYSDLADPQWRGRICTRSGKHEYNVALFAAHLAHVGEEDTRDWLQGLKNNLARKPSGNDRAQVKAIAEGECDVALINSYYMGAMQSDPKQQNWANAVNVIFPDQDGHGTHMNVSGMVMAAHAPHRDNALKLMEYLAGDEAQRLYGELNHEYPVKESIPTSELVRAWGSFRRDDLPLDNIAAKRVDASKMVDMIGYDQ